MSRRGVGAILDRADGLRWREQLELLQNALEHAQDVAAELAGELQRGAPSQEQTDRMLSALARANAWVGTVRVKVRAPRRAKHAGAPPRPKNYPLDEYLQDIERGERFFGSCGLIRSDVTPKPAWAELKAQTARERSLPLSKADCRVLTRATPGISGGYRGGKYTP